MEIAPASGKLGILLVGLGAVSTTFVAGVEAIKRGLAKPIGSLTQMGTIRLGKRTENRFPQIKDFVPLADLDDIVFGAWDIFPDNAFDAAMKAGVLEKDLLNQVSEQLASLKPMAAVFEQNYVKRITGENVKTGKNKMDLAEQLIEEIARFKSENNCDRLVMVWAASTEIFLEESAVHESLEAFEKAMYDSDPTHRAVDDLCLRRAQIGRSVCQRRAESDRRHSGADRTGRANEACRSAARISRPGRR